MIFNALTIAGSDPSGGAGIQADLKTFSALGAYGTTVVTALTAQNTQRVDAVHHVPADFLAAQLETLFTDVRIDTVKIGMLGTSDAVRVVAQALQRHAPRYVVLDPVMVAKSGDRLLAADAVEALRERLLHRVDLLTPNLPEAAALLGEREAPDEEGMREQLVRLGDLSPRVLLKGGHLPGSESVDLLLSEEGQVTRLPAPRVQTRNTHGTGCTLSAAVAALRPQHEGWDSAVSGAKDYVTASLRAADALDVGAGQGPLHHFHAWWPSERST